MMDKNPSAAARSVLVVAAHPDDEVLGFGATGAALALSGVSVRACILSARVDARTQRPSDADLAADTARAQKILGFQTPVLGDFPNLRFNTVAHIELVQFIESAIAQSRATAIVTHHPMDVNDDHTCTSRACQAAARLFQRRSDLVALSTLHFMEVPSSTDWSFPAPGAGFSPDTFVYAGGTLDKKLEALAAYRGVMREYPHPRSEQALRGLASMRGAQAGLHYAEAFQTAFRRVEAAAAL